MSKRKKAFFSLPFRSCGSTRGRSPRSKDKWPHTVPGRKKKDSHPQQTNHLVPLIN